MVQAESPPINWSRVEALEMFCFFVGLGLFVFLFCLFAPLLCFFGFLFVIILCFFDFCLLSINMFHISLFVFWGSLSSEFSRFFNLVCFLLSGCLLCFCVVQCFLVFVWCFAVLFNVWGCW